MKHTHLAAMLAVSAVALTACGSNAVINDGLKEKAVSGMTAEKAAGHYELTDFYLGQGGKSDAAIDKSAFESASLALTADGVYTLEATAGSQAENVTGHYTVADNGYLTLSDDAYIAAQGEKLLCDGANVYLVGRLGTQTEIRLTYTDPDKIAEAEKAAKQAAKEEAAKKVAEKKEAVEKAS